MRDEKRNNEFQITVNGQKLEEIRAQDGHTYVIMPLFSKASYGVEFTEEIQGHGGTAVATLPQKWPVCPYKVVATNLCGKTQDATLFVDGQEVDFRYVYPFSYGVIEGIPTFGGVQELQFSLPRFVSLQEKSRDSGSSLALKRWRAKDIGEIKVVWQDAVQTHSQWENRRLHEPVSFTHANKMDASATGGGAGSGNTAHASTTRAGRVVEPNEPQLGVFTYYNTVGLPTESRLLYRTQHHLEGIGVIGNKETDAESAERKAKRARRRKKTRLQQGFSSQPQVPDDEVEVVKPPPASTDHEVIVL